MPGVHRRAYNVAKADPGLAKRYGPADVPPPNAVERAAGEKRERRADELQRIYEPRARTGAACPCTRLSRVTGPSGA